MAGKRINKPGCKVKHCYDCRVELTKNNWYAANKNLKPYPAYICNHCSNRRKLYCSGLSRSFTKNDYDDLSALQNGVCAICGGENENGKSLSIDHDHETGKVRGLLCHRCNLWLGVYEHNKDKCEKYLRS